MVGIIISENDDNDGWPLIYMCVFQVLIQLLGFPFQYMGNKDKNRSANKYGMSNLLSHFI